jgi:hexosaminidase
MSLQVLLLTAVALSHAFDVPALWPQPQQVQWSGSEIHVAMSVFGVQIAPNSYVDGILQRAIKRYVQSVFFVDQGSDAPWPASSPALSSVRVFVRGGAALKSGVDESYTLNVPVDGSAANITANTVFGALHAFETLAQLIRVGGAHAAVAGASIVDFPRFEFRGFLHDTARHFLPVPVLLKAIDALAMNKFNVFHWHIVDDQSFPFVSTTFPKLADGAWSPTHTYSPAQVKAVIAYAQDRGVRVVPEFDSPGHSTSWGVGYPSLLTQCYDQNGQPTGTTGPLDPTQNATYAFVQQLYQEIASVFADDWIHMGGDEVPFDCWQSNPAIQAWMKARGWTDYAKLESFYVDHVLQNIASANKTPLVWEEVFDNGAHITRDTVVDAWKGHWQITVAEITYAGYRAVLSQPWYLNYISYGDDIWQYYQVEPTAFPGTPAQKQLVVGGEACMWGEFVDATNVLSRTWPRAAAIGERLWSAANVTDVNDAAGRLAAWQCRMVVRGIPAEPALGPGYCAIEY